MIFKVIRSPKFVNKMHRYEKDERAKLHLRVKWEQKGCKNGTIMES